VGELEDIPDKRFGFGLPNRREMAQKYYRILGHIIRFDPGDYADKAKIRTKLGYGNEPLLICATGGTSAGKELFETCGKTYVILIKNVPDLRIVCICGELFGRKPPELPHGVELHSYIPDLYEHYTACDMAVVVGGGTTTTELTALRRPFIFFPLENQFDQQLNVANRLTRQGAGIKMRYHQTSPESLADTILAHIGKEVDWKPIPTDGAQKAAELINDFLVVAT
jgi:UDP-N-acetylglucosamine:LPS N-acetylglucosamine transferase